MLPSHSGRPGLSAVGLGELGRFEAAPATFTVTTPSLPRRWDYLFANEHTLLRIGQDGVGHLQARPPEGILLFRPERLEKTPVLHVWLQPAGEAPFSNFPLAHAADDDAAQGAIHTCTFSPGEARYTRRQTGWTVETRLTLAPDSPALLLRLKITRTSTAPSSLRVVPCLRPHVGPAVLAPWDVLELYQLCHASARPAASVVVETRSPAGRVEERHRAVWMTDLPCDRAELSLDRFAGGGDFIRPDALRTAALPVALDAPGSSLRAQAPVAALEAWLDFEPGRSREYSVVLASATGGDEETLLANAHRLLDADCFANGAQRLADEHRDWCARFSVRTPDSAFDDYINHWLPAQLHWVGRLDRGWPSGLRGTRDAAQDFSGVARLFPPRAKSMLIDILSCQRSDGWFPRQFSIHGPQGRHDLRDYVDSGCWVLELIVDLLQYGGDPGLLDEPARWLDDPRTGTVREHAERLLDYYLSPGNRGAHGLVLIRGGDWNDALNQAGVEGRGESVMVSCHVVHLLDLAARWLCPTAEQATAWAQAAIELREAIRRHALNKRGFLNGVFTDRGEWVFSDHDPDGACRPNGAVNAFGLIARVFEREEMDGLLAQLDRLKGPHGWRLFYPPLGEPAQVHALGRLGTGDLVPGAGENGTVYNHGSQGFLARALAVIGDGERLWTVIRHILPYEQTIHPVEVARTAPYAIVNHWMETPEHDGEGGAAFLSGTISTLQRVVLNGLLGFQVEPDGVHIRPVLPSHWPGSEFTFRFRDAELVVAITREDSAPRTALDGKEMKNGRIPFSAISAGQRHEVKVIVPQRSRPPTIAAPAASR